MAELIPLALKDAPALIESVFPAQKVSFEAQRERGAGPAQTLTALGSYWKGRKPLILVRAIVLGSLLPSTDNAEKDLAIFEKLMAFDEEGLVRRAFARNAFSATKIQETISINNPDYYFTSSGRSWNRNVLEEEKIELYRQALATIVTYEEKSLVGRRPEEVDQEWLLGPIWPAINDYYKKFGIKANSIPELVEQLGILRYGRKPKIGDTFSGGGSIPFEAARVGCDVYASDLNPVACMLTWGAFNIIGVKASKRKEIEAQQREIVEIVQKKIRDLKIEVDENGNQAKAYLYCVEVQCPETGWKVPLSTSWVISKMRNVIAELTPNYNTKSFDIKVLNNVTDEELKLAEKGTVQASTLVYELEGRIYRTPISTLRGNYRTPEGETKSNLRLWIKRDFKPLASDVFQERLYAVQWITKETINKGRQETFYAEVTEDDLQREKRVENIICENIEAWQNRGLIPDMPIESGYNTDQPIRERGWTHWHHLFNARQLLYTALLKKYSNGPATYLAIANTLDFNSKLCGWGTSKKWDGGPVHTFTTQALNTNYNYAQYSTDTLTDNIFYKTFAAKDRGFQRLPNLELKTASAKDVDTVCDQWITDPPYADAVNYHEITEFFIAWLRKNPPHPFDEWIWDSRRALAVKGEDEGFRHGMVNAYKAMAKNMPDNGMQCVMFTHQDTGVWSDMVSIFWAAGLQVVAAWYIATETTQGYKSGGYVQGTVTLMLKKRLGGEHTGFKQRLLPAVRNEVRHQIESMMHLNDQIENKHGEAVFNDSDLQMAGYAAALKVLTAYTHIGGEDVTNFALRPRTKGEVTIVDEIVEQAAEAANSLLVPEGLSKETWQKINGIQRFYMRMMDIETTGASKLDNYQNFAKAFRVDDYSQVMQSMAANKSRLKRIPEFSSRDLSDSTEIGATWLGSLVIGLQQLLQDIEPKVVVEQLMQDLPDFLEVRTTLIDILAFIEHKAPDEETRKVAEILAARLRNMRALGQD